MTQEREAARNAMRHLLDPTEARDSRAFYYAFLHPDAQTTLTAYPADAREAAGYVCLARTGYDLFRPIVTLRLDRRDHEKAANVIYAGIPSGMPIIVNVPARYETLMGAFMNIDVIEKYRILELDVRRFKPQISVLMQNSKTHNGLPRFFIPREGKVIASANINWQTDRFAEIGVMTDPAHRRRDLGKSVVSGAVKYVLDSGRRPIFATSLDNDAAHKLGNSVGFLDTGIRDSMIHGTLRARDL